MPDPTPNPNPTPPQNPFLATLPEDLRSDPGLQPFKDAGGLAKSYIETKKMVGGMIKLPAEGATPEELAEWKTKHGEALVKHGVVTAPPSEYVMPTIEGYHPDGEMVTKFTELAKKHGIPQGAVDELMAFDAERSKFIQGQVSVLTVEQADAEMKATLGADYPGVNENVSIATKALNEEYPGLINEEKMSRTFVVELDENGKPGKTYPMSKHPMFYGLLDQIGALTREDHSGTVGRTAGGKSLDDVDRAIDNIMRKGGSKYDAYMKGDQRIAAELAKLFEEKAALMPEGAAAHG